MGKGGDSWVKHGSAQRSISDATSMMVTILQRWSRVLETITFVTLFPLTIRYKLDSITHSNARLSALRGGNTISVYRKLAKTLPIPDRETVSSVLK